MKYLCCQCGRDFLTTEAIDGLRFGYHKGFVCPYCRTNLEDEPLSLAMVNRIFGNAKYLVLGFAASLSLAAHLLRSGSRVGILGVDIPLWLAAVGVAVVFGAILVIKYPSVVFSQIVPTRAIANPKVIGPKN